jgi:anthranilate phosphoribosyltransferase
VTPEQLGLTRAPLASIVGGDVEVNARILRGVLEGATGPTRDVVLLNAAAGILVAGLAKDLRDGVEAARRAIDDGAARDELERWVAAGRGSVA